MSTEAHDAPAGALRKLSATVRHSHWGGLAVVVIAGAVVAGGVLVATRPSAPPSPARTSTRAVALGDSVPYGHGLANPYSTPQPGLPNSDVAQGPSPVAYPSLVAGDLGLAMTVRPTNCRLVGDQLAISGAVANAADNTERDGQCTNPPRQARNLSDELDAAGLPKHPAHLVLLQDGADDIHFSACLEYELARVPLTALSLGTNCIENSAVTSQVATELARVRKSLASAIETVAPNATTIAVLNYYQPVPEPSQVADDSEQSGLGTNLVCTGLKANAAATAAAAQVVLSALNHSIAGAVADARADGVRNARLVDVSNTLAGHGICTADPWVFSSELVPDTTLAKDAADILAAKACKAAAALPTGTICASETARANQAEQNIKSYVWRTAHPTAAGQRALASAVEQALRGGADS